MFHASYIQEVLFRLHLNFTCMTIRLIKWPLSVSILLFCCSGTLYSQRTLPQVAVKQLDGKATDIATISNNGKPIILFVWEVTCQPCIAEFNNVSKLYPKWKEETGVRILAVSVDDNRSSSRVKPLVTSRGWDFDVYLDPNQAFKRAMNVPLCPYVFVLNGSGEVVWKKGGYSPGDEDIIYEVVQKAGRGESVE